MRYSLEPRYRRYVQGQGFMSFAKNIGNKYGRKIFYKSIDVGKNIKNKYGRKILWKVLWMVEKKAWMLVKTLQK